MYLLGPVLILLALGIIGCLTYVYFRIVLPMLAGTNWVTSEEEWDGYWEERGYVVASRAQIEQLGKHGEATVSTFYLILLALSTPKGMLHTTIVTFFLFNIIYNYYRCVTTSNSGPSYYAVVRELASVTGFQYPETDEELVQCRKDLEKKIMEKVNKRRRELMGVTTNHATANTNGTSNLHRDEESQDSTTSPLLATSAINTEPSTTTTTTPNNTNSDKPKPKQIPRIHNWQLLSPIEWSYCRYSSHPKPPRSHYDHVTKSLVLNQDHYCPWMFNCVGYFNYRYFFNFLWFVTIALFYGIGVLVRPFMNLSGVEYRDQVRASGGISKSLKDIVVKHFKENAYIPTPEERSPVAFGFMICLSVGLAVMCLAVFHTYLLFSAQTTIEFHGNFAKRRTVGWKNPYSAETWRGNWEMVFGHRRSNGCMGVLVAMLPSRREPEFLPIPIDGKLVRRKHRVDASGEICKEEVVEMAPLITTPIGSLTTINVEGTDMMMEPNDSNATGRLKERSGRNMSRDEEHIV